MEMLYPDGEAHASAAAYDDDKRERERTDGMKALRVSDTLTASALNSPLLHLPEVLGRQKL